MSNFKRISDHMKAAERFLHDLDDNSMITYNISDFKSDIIPSVYPESYTNKCTHAAVVLSGCSIDYQDYMVICPYRVDWDKKEQRMVYDIDPLIITFDSISKTPSPIAVIGYHQPFPERTSPIPNISFSDIYTSVSQLKSNILTKHDLLSSVPLPVENGLHHMANYLRRNINK